jgi:hypothetical protein
MRPHGRPMGPKESIHTSVGVGGAWALSGRLMDMRPLDRRSVGRGGLEGRVSCVIAERAEGVRTAMDQDRCIYIYICIYSTHELTNSVTNPIYAINLLNLHIYIQICIYICTLL